MTLNELLRYVVIEKYRVLYQGRLYYSESLIDAFSHVTEDMKHQQVLSIYADIYDGDPIVTIILKGH